MCLGVHGKALGSEVLALIAPGAGEKSPEGQRTPIRAKPFSRDGLCVLFLEGQRLL